MSTSTSLRLGPIACLIGLSALGLAIVPAQHGAPARAEARLAKASPAVYALLHVGKPKRWTTEADRDDAYRKGKAGMFRSRGILDNALREPQIASLQVVQTQKDARSWLEKSLRAEYFDHTPILRVSLTVGMPDEQVAILNAVMRAYLRHVEEDRKSVMESLEFYKRFLADCIQRIPQLEYKLVALNDVEARSEAEAQGYAYQRNVTATELAQVKEGMTTTFPRRIKAYEDLLRNMPRLLDWAAKPEPAE